MLTPGETKKIFKHSTDPGVRRAMTKSVILDSGTPQASLRAEHATGLPRRGRGRKSAFWRIAYKLRGGLCVT
ncbi:hypothetical protein OS493_040394, partial [Desmophyllum pertusum]